MNNGNEVELLNAQHHAQNVRNAIQATQIMQLTETPAEQAGGYTYRWMRPVTVPYVEGGDRGFNLRRNPSNPALPLREDELAMRQNVFQKLNLNASIHHVNNAAWSIEDARREQDMHRKRAMQRALSDTSLPKDIPQHMIQKYMGPTHVNFWETNHPSLSYFDRSAASQGLIGQPRV